MKNKNVGDKGLTLLFVVVLLFFMCTVGIRFLTRQIVVERLGVTNWFTKLVFCDNTAMGQPVNPNEDLEVDQSIIYWEQRYPFDESDLQLTNNGTKIDLSEKYMSLSNRLNEYLMTLKYPIEAYTSDSMFGYVFLTSAAKVYERIIQWNFTPFKEYNNLQKLGDNYFYSVVERKDVTDSAESTIRLAEYCEQQNITFLYVQMPSKISKYEDTDISGITDFCNQNADAFLRLIADEGVNSFDLREAIYEEGMSHHTLFFETDHHWKGETGLWAAGKILDKMKELGLDTDSSVLSPGLFDYVVYEKWFLGSQGKKATLANAVPDDITLIYPKAKTLFAFSIPDLKVNLTGDFSIMYDMNQIQKKDYYNKWPYATFIYGDHPLITIENNLIEKNDKVLVIHNSYANCVIPFLAMDVKHIDSLDLRSFTGSVKSFVKDCMPDMVIVAYPCDQPGKVDYSSHTAPFDFR